VPESGLPNLHVSRNGINIVSLNMCSARASTMQWKQMFSTCSQPKSQMAVAVCVCVGPCIVPYVLICLFPLVLDCSP
jgi:hypothetical protein